MLMQVNCAADLMGLLAHFMYRFQPLYNLYACVDMSRASICYRLHAAWPLQSQPLNHCEGSSGSSLGARLSTPAARPCQYIGRAGEDSLTFPYRFMYPGHIFLETAMCRPHPCYLLLV